MVFISTDGMDAAEALRSSPPATWWIAFVTGLCTVVGVTCKMIDTDRGETRLRASNAFAAGYSMLMFLLSFQWLVLDLGGGTLPGVRAALVSRPWVDLVDGASQGQQICVYMLAYMAQDMVVRCLFWELDLRYILHHLACLGGLGLVLFAGLHPVYCVALSVSEFSTPIVCLFEIAQAELGSMKKYIMPCGILLNLCFPVRVAWFTWVFYLVAFEYRKHSFYQLSIENCGFLCTGLLVLVNWSWYFDLLVGSVRTLLEDSSPAEVDTAPDPSLKKAQ
ncbi:Hypothetical Protein FCC1311_019162 [Hondaea fermentalgiana]|uniref:TLC domain-containing protein n=1 Tax=Hondaea fermentalgiana TaxID=2315210 RepID=A0A2R5G3T0_9STRA|nr:Hypothetical Protein FCC1311_019162 [Hondaea fermentalgiana]|eukprot:GBG25697.1 Hypothetical Protein FCC1311_019162 [Hondaea fermentalgiana]